MPVVNGKYVVPCSPKQNELRALCRTKRFVLANGTRLSTKSVGCCFCVCDHAWEVKDANIAIITFTQSVGFDSGIWDDLTKKVIPERIAGDFGFVWVKPPFNEGVSKRPTCIVRNKWGQAVKIQLHSLKDENEVESRFKGPRFTMIYVPEMSTFRFEKTFQTWCECLRMPGELGKLSGTKKGRDIHLFLGDTNPSPDGTESFIYKIWFELLDADEADVQPDRLELKRNLARLDFTIDDNIFDSKERLDLLKSQYASDQDLYDRYILGKWVRATTDAIFYGVWSDQLHTAGDPARPDDPLAEILMPEPDCFELMTGWDLGDRNCAFVIEEKVNLATEKGPSVPAFKVIDEHIIIGQDFILDEFVEVVLEKMDLWERRLERVGQIRWTHWSDRNVMTVRDLSGRLYLNQAIHIASDRRIILEGAYDAQRGSGSVDLRLALTRKMLFENRIMVSRRCPKTIEMFKSIRRKMNSATGIAKGSKFKHAFDASSYIWCSVCYEEMAKATLDRTGKGGPRSSNLVQVATLPT